MPLETVLGNMDPNSKNQRWGKWVFVVWPGGLKRPTFADVKHNASRFGRARFGQASTMRVNEHHDAHRGRFFEIAVRSEGHPVHDPTFVAWMHAQWSLWAVKGFGAGTLVELVEAKLEAGDKQDGSPRDQLIMMAPLQIEDEDLWPSQGSRPS